MTDCRLDYHSRSRTGMDGSLTSNLNFKTLWKICRRIIINLSKVRNTVHFITVITATWRRRRNALVPNWRQLCSQQLNCNRLLVISPWTMAMLESDMVKNEECRTVLLTVYAVFKSLAFWHPHITNWAIAKMTARCALGLYMVPWKFSRAPEYAHGYFSRNF